LVIARKKNASRGCDNESNNRIEINAAITLTNYITSSGGKNRWLCDSRNGIHGVLRWIPFENFIAGVDWRLICNPVLE
jgi:hypothetical protein